MKLALKIVIFAALTCGTLLAQSGHGTFSGYLLQVNPDGARHKFATTGTDINLTFSSMGVVIGTPAVDSGDGTCGTNFYAEGARLGGGVSPAFFVPAGQSLIYFTFPTPWVDGSVIASLSAQQVGNCTSPAGDINLTAKYTY